MSAENQVTIAGAGPAGLSAAITLAQAGRKVVVHEVHSNVGWRFQQDFQGLENWTTKRDVLKVFEDLNITTDFKKQLCYEGTAFDAWGDSYEINSKQPLFYMIERGPGNRSLDHALLQQAQAADVEVRFNSKLNQISGQGILAKGPKVADAIAIGYHFKTHMKNGFWVICDDRIAPKGYAYLLIWNGRGTVKSCMFSDFKHGKKYVDRTVSAFKRLMGLSMEEEHRHCGIGNFRLPKLAYSGQHPVVGEQAGFQDTLWGFGIRYAIWSGVLAARSILLECDYEQLWRQHFERQLKTSIVNRGLYEALGNRGYRWLLKSRHRTENVRHFLRHNYRGGRWKRLLLCWAHSRYKNQRKNVSGIHPT